jgi:hypothetical protein
MGLISWGIDSGEKPHYPCITAATQDLVIAASAPHPHRVPAAMASSSSSLKKQGK